MLVRSRRWACAIAPIADLAEAARRKPDDPRPWVVRGRLLAERGDGPGADAAYARAAGLAPGRLDPFLEAGWWVAGPYPEDMNQPQPPEEDPDPARPVAGETGTPLRWKPACVNEDRYLHLGPFAGRPRSSVYAMTHLASDRERTAMLCLSGGDRVRVWLNGRARLRRGSAARLSSRAGIPGARHAPRRTEHAAREGEPRLGRPPSCASAPRISSWIARIFLAEFGRWSEAADLFDRADRRGQFLHPWPKARQVELLAALGDRDRYLRAAAAAGRLRRPGSSRSLRRGPCGWA